MDHVRNHNYGLKVLDDVVPESWNGVTLNSDPKSPESFELARKWIAECLSSHDSCKGQRTDTAPTRLLKIARNGSDFHVRLVKGSGKNLGRILYAALSYCWGGDQPFKLTRAGMAAAEKSMEYSVLPKTIQDAIQVTIGLGYEYLWIDSLCIVQDDERDKAYEIAQMPAVYGGSVVTICATSADSVTRGFLGVRHGVYAEPIRLRLQRVNGTEEVCYLQGVDVNRRKPLESRAWALQEAILSYRILKYENHHFGFSCKYDAYLNKDRFLWNGESYFNKSHTDLGLAHMSYLHLTDISGSDRVAQYRGFDQPWEEIVEEYSGRKLTRPEDRPLAISAIANQAARQQPGDTYLAGLWSTEFPHALLWFTWVPEAYKTRLPSAYTERSPSWSWWKTEDKIRFSYMNLSWERKYYTQMISSEIILEDPRAPFGAAKRGTLTLSTKLQAIEFRAKAYKHRQRWEKTSPYFFRSSSSRGVIWKLSACNSQNGDTLDTRLTHNSLCLDFPESFYVNPGKFSNQRPQFFLMYIVQRSSPEKDDVTVEGLIIKRQEQESPESDGRLVEDESVLTAQRVGHWEMSKDDWFHLEPLEESLHKDFINEFSKGFAPATVQLV